MFTIGEFSTISGIPVRTLRFYHEEGLLVPAAVDVETGYRSYDERNLELANVIVELRKLEFSLDDIREILAGTSDDADLLAHLQRQRASISGRLQHFRDVVKKLDHMIRQQREAQELQKMAANTYKVEERDVEPMLVAGLRMQGRYSDIGQGFGTLYKRIGRYAAGKPMCLYYDGEYREKDANFEPCVPMRKFVEANGISIRELPAAHLLTLVHRGPYEELSRSYARIMKHAKEHGYEVMLPTREVYLKGPGMIFRGNPKKYLTELQLPVKKHGES
jgi:DNA-binding transcriptional MerR regulator/effector-binding domain-containing protein